MPSPVSSFPATVNSTYSLPPDKPSSKFIGQESLEDAPRVESTLGLTQNLLQFVNIQQDMSRAIKASKADSCITRLA